MSQRAYLRSVMDAVSRMDPQEVTKICEAKTRMQEIILEYGESGRMALAILGLEHAVQAEDEEAMKIVL